MLNRNGALTLAKTAAKIMGDPWFWHQSKREFHQLVREYPKGTPDDILAVVNGYQGFGWYKRLGAYQVDQEFASLAAWARSQSPRVVVEIGTASGATLLMWSRIASRQVISIDLPGGIHGGGYAEAKMRLFHEFVHDRPGVRVDLIRASSQDPATRARACDLLAGNQIDILFIDGDHRLEGVTRDFQLWRDLVAPGGSIVFHDILPHTKVKSCQVDVLWNQLKQQYPGQTEEIVADRSQGWAGIGILNVRDSLHGGAEPGSLRAEASE